MIKDFLIISFLFIVIDSIYLSISSKYFKNQIKIIQKSQLELNKISTIICYIILTLGITYFIKIKNLSIIDTGILGFFIYSVFETTNKALFKKWKWLTVLMDSIWGGILFSLVAFIYKKINL